MIETAALFFDLLADKRRSHPDVCVVTADMGPATRAERFQRAHPDHFHDVGIAEQDMVCFACGLTLARYVPVVTSASILLTGRPWEQIRNMVDRGRYNVKLVGTGSGLTNTRHSLGLTMLEDLALLGGLRHLEAYSPFDATDIVAVVDRLVERDGPAYVRLGRYDVADRSDTSPPRFSPLRIHGEGDVALVTTGFLVANALRAQQQLAREGRAVRVVNLVQVLPFPAEEVLGLLADVDEVVVLEDHLPAGGLGSHVALLLAESGLRVRFHRIGPRRLDRCVGGLEDNLAEHGMSDADVLARLGGTITDRRRDR